MQAMACSPETERCYDTCTDRTSPVSIDHKFDDSVVVHKRQVLPLATLSLSFLYQELTKHRLWIARFERGGYDGSSPAVRTLATRHLGSPATDGWNVVAGAVELANAWAFDGANMYTTVSSSYDLPRGVRLRLVACLSVSWKFERQLSSRFPRHFYDEEPNLISPHTCELAYLAYSFLSDTERAEFGGWGAENSTRIRALYKEMVALEADLLINVPVFSTLMHGNQVQAEARLQELFDEEILNSKEVMITRSIIPFFNAAWQNGYAMQPTAGALVCAAMTCLCIVAIEEGAPSEDMATIVRQTFVPAERKRATELLRSGLFLKQIPSAIVLLGCYSDPTWVNYAYMCSSVLERAL